MTTISHKTLKLIKNLLIAFVIIGPFAWGKEFFKITNPYGNSVELTLAQTPAQQTKGLSGIKSQNFKNSQGMLFINSEMGERRFWMPETFFNLDIIFLDQNLKIVGLEKNVPAHPGMMEPPEIYRTKIYFAQYVLETKATSRFGVKLKISDQLNFSGTTSLSEIVQGTHRPQ
jgi:uncharacterized membrane protein (UPF0127 family)